MKVLRIDRQNVCNGAVYKNLESLRDDLCSFHSIDWDSDDDIYSLTLDQIMDYGEWDYEMITDEEAKQYEDQR
jgi:hypothetical protein